MQILHLCDVNILLICEFLCILLAVGFKLVLVLVSLPFKMSQRKMSHQQWEMFRNLVDLSVKLSFHELYTDD